MDRLTKRLTILQPTTFHQCQLCGYQSNDIVEFQMWIECDEQDKAEENNYLILCKKKVSESYGETSTALSRGTLGSGRSR